MPIYEYRCSDCGRRVQLFFRSFSAVSEAACPHCGSSNLGRLPSRVARVRSESDSLDFFSDPTNLDRVDYNDPRSVAQWARQMGEATGADLGPDYDEIIAELEHGEGLSGAGFADQDDDFSA